MRLHCSQARTEPNTDQRVLRAWKQLAAEYSPFGGLEFAGRVAELANYEEEGVKLSASTVHTRLISLRNKFVEVLSRSVEGDVPAGKEVEEFEHFERVQEIILTSREARRARVQQRRDYQSREIVVLQGTLDGETGARTRATGVQEGKEIGHPARASVPPLLSHDRGQESDGGSGVFDGNRANTGAILASAKMFHQLDFEGKDGGVGHLMARTAGNIVFAHPSEKSVFAHPSATVHRGLTLDKPSTQPSGQAKSLSACHDLKHNEELSSVHVDRGVAKPLSRVAGAPQASMGRICDTTGVARGGESSKSHSVKRGRLSETLPRPSGIDAVHTGDEAGRRKQMRRCFGKADNRLTGNERQKNGLAKRGDTLRPRHALRNSRGQFRPRTAEEASKTASNSGAIESRSEGKQVKDARKGEMRKIGSKHNESLNGETAENHVEENRGMKDADNGKEDGNHKLSVCLEKGYEKTVGADYEHGEIDDRKAKQRSEVRGDGVGGEVVRIGMGRAGDGVESVHETELKESRSMEVDGEHRSANRMTRVQTMEPKLVSTGQETQMTMTEGPEDAEQVIQEETAGTTNGNAQTRVGDRRKGIETKMGYNKLSKSAEIMQYLMQIEDMAEAEAEEEVEKVWRGMLDIAGLRFAEGENEFHNGGGKESEEIRRKKMDRDDDDRRWNHTKRLVEELRKSAVVMRKLGMTAQAEACMKKVVELLDEEVQQSSRPL